MPPPGEFVKIRPGEDMATAMRRLKGEPLPEGPGPFQQFMRGGISALSMAPAMMVGGAGPTRALMRMALEGLGPGLAEVVMQKLDLAPESGADIAAAALTPIATRAGLGLPGVVRGAARGGTMFAFPQTIRQTGRQAFKEEFAGAKSDPLFAFARKQGPVPTTSVVSSIDTAIAKEAGMSTPNNAALKLLRNLKDKFRNKPEVRTVESEGGITLTTATERGFQEQIKYSDLIDEMQRLRLNATTAFKKGNNVTGQALSQARKDILDAMDDISPAIKKANNAYRRESATLEISKQLRKSDPSIAVENLFEQDELIAGIFSKTERTAIQDIADRIARASTGSTLGAANRFLMAFAEPAAEAMQEPGGRALMRILMKNPRDPKWINRWGAVILTQFGRGGFARFGEEEVDPVLKVEEQKR